jgi:hypothetical protein
MARRARDQIRVAAVEARNGGHLANARDYADLLPGAEALVARLEAGDPAPG